MFKNYLKTAVRNIVKYKGYSLINIFGLAVGIACCILIMLFVRNELSYDTFHENKDDIYRAYCTFELSSGRTITTPNLPIPFGPAVRADLPEVEGVVRSQNREGVVRQGDNLVRQDLLFVDPEILDVFTFPLIAGFKETALSSPDAVVISRPMADKFFPDSDPIGASISIRLNEEELPFFVSGVVENVPDNSSIRFDFLVPFEKLFSLSEGAYERAEDWNSYSTITFLQLNEASPLERLNTKLPAFVEKHFNDPAQIILQPLTDIHLNPEIGSGGLEPVSDPKYSYILSGIALAVLLIACINFMTLTLGRSSGRAREVGMRKVLGAHRLQLLKQFWGEGLLMSFFALIFGIGIAEAFLPKFNVLTEKSLTPGLSLDLLPIIALTGLTLLVGLIAGGYPAVLLSRYQAVDVFKEKFKLSGATLFGKILVVFQFTLSVFLIICTLIISDQKNFLMTKNLGYRGEQVVVIPTIRDDDGTRLLQKLRNALSTQSRVASLSGASYSFERGIHRVSASFEEQDIRANEYRVDHAYIETLGMELVQGRDFSKEIVTDETSAAIVNEALVEAFGWEDPVGKTFLFRGTYNLTVVGVVSDYHFESLHQEIAPVVLHMNPATPLRYLLAKIRPDDMPGTLAMLRTEWQKLAPDLPFESYFLNNDVARQYQAEQRWGQIITYAAGFAILIACLGLFGLASLSVTKRTKEIGIRKVLGASVEGLVGLISKEFLVLVLLGNVVAWPVAFLAMQKWLETFAYRTDLGVSFFLIAAAVALLIALVTVSFHAVKASLANPVDSLRYE